MTATHPLNKSFKVLGIFEGLSLLALFFIAMPLKYLAGDPQAVRVVGMAHGLLFVAYMANAVVLASGEGSDEKWPMKKLLICLILSCLPCGTFIFEKKYHQQTMAS